MAIHKLPIKIGNIHFFFGAVAFFVSSIASSAAAPSFTATLDRNEIGLDETISLKLSIVLDGNQQPQEPQFRAPDFEVVNEYNSTFIKSYYDNGHFGMQNEKQITKVLKPLKKGTLNIRSISVQVGRDFLKTPDLVVIVNESGAGTPPPAGFNSGGAGLRNSSARNQGKNIFVRAEVDKQKVYKGEQIIVSYYLYTHVRMFNLNVDAFPQLNGFLKEELEMAVSGQPLPSDSVVVGGIPYERKLLARYAAYPLQEGTLKMDSMSLKYEYVGGNSNHGDDQDPFSQLFHQMAPQSGQSSSEPLNIEVKPLPDPKPDSFSGGVGDFSIISAADKTEVHANEAVTVTVKVEGRGNVAAVGEPKAKWPDGVELYDSKGTAKIGKAGVGEKDFEFLLIPRTTGKITLPTLEMSYFDPVSSKYVTRSTQSIEVNVLPAVPGSPAYTPPKAVTSPDGAANGAAAPRSDEMKPLKPYSAEHESGFHFQGHPGWRWLYWLCAGCFVLFISFVGVDRLRSWRKKSAHAAGLRAKLELKSFEKLRARAKAAAKDSPWIEVIEAYELLSGAVLDQLDFKYHVGARSHSRSQLQEMLVEERALPVEIWLRISRLLEYAELVRFAISAGAITESAARSELLKWVNEGEFIVLELGKIK